MDSIKICVEYLWRFYYKHIIRAVIIPYVLYQAIFVIYALYFYDGEPLEGFKANHLFGSFVLLRSLFFFYFQIQMARSSGKKYFKSSNFLWASLELL